MSASVNRQHLSGATDSSHPGTVCAGGAGPRAPESDQADFGRLGAGVRPRQDDGWAQFPDPNARSTQDGSWAQFPPPNGTPSCTTEAPRPEPSSEPVQCQADTTEEGARPAGLDSSAAM